MTGNAVDFTEKFVRDLPLSDKRQIFRCVRVRGLSLRVTKTKKTWYAAGDIWRDKRLIKPVTIWLGTFPDMGIANARREAMIALAAIKGGHDPRRPKPKGATLADVLEIHLGERDLRPASIRDYTYIVNGPLARLKGRPVVDISPDDVRELLDDLQRTKGQATAGGAMRVLKALLNTARRHDPAIVENVCYRVKIPPTPRRTIEAFSIPDFWAATAKLTPIMMTLQRTFLLTGARRGSLLRVRREDVDTDAATICFRHLKTSGESLTIPTGRFLTAMLAARMADDEPLGSEWLWPSPTSDSGHVEETKTRFGAIPSSHVLRHAAKSLCAGAGVPLLEGSLLTAHALPSSMAALYTHPHLIIEQLRPHMQALEDLILREAGEGA